MNTYFKLLITYNEKKNKQMDKYMDIFILHYFFLVKNLLHITEKRDYKPT